MSSQIEEVVRIHLKEACQLVSGENHQSVYLEDNPSFVNQNERVEDFLNEEVLPTLQIFAEGETDRAEGCEEVVLAV